MDQYIGKLLDNRYELLERIGTGGMAVVYKARCHRLNRLVAVKILKPELAEDVEFRRRFHDESRAVAMLSHPNIVAVYDVSRSDNLDYIVMELIDGITLKQYMQKRGTPLNWREAQHFITQIVKALGHAHSRGIIHRDIKPHNVMVLRDGSVKVADFGIARLASSAQSTLTQEALGSVHYISPEQAKGSHIDGRSDIYSSGVVLYEMITGRLPYEGETAVAVAIQHINSIPIPPRELNPEVPEALQEITLKAMCPDVHQRYASADDMLEALEEFRKNPNIRFDYTPAELREYENESEPTQVVSAAQIRAEREESLRRRQGEDSMRRRPSEDSGRHRQSEASRRRWEEDDEDDEPPRRGIPAALIAVVVILLFIGGIAAFLWNSFFSPLFEPVDTYEVPDLTGMTMEEIYADTELTDVWKIMLSDSYISTDEYEYGQVARQEPGAETVVKENNLSIMVFLSSGKDDGEIRMPSLVGKEIRSAKDMLTALGLHLEIEEREETSESLNKDYVISTEPEMGTVLEEGQTVVLVVSSGRESKPATVPYLENVPLEEAQRMIEESGLTFGGVTQVSHETIEAGRVIFQSIPARTEVEEGTPITLQVSTGPARPNTEEPTEEPTDEPTASPSDEPSPTQSEEPSPPPSQSEEPSPPPSQSEEPSPPPSQPVDPSPPPSQSVEPSPPPSQDVPASAEPSVPLMPDDPGDGAPAG